MPSGNTWGSVSGSSTDRKDAENMNATPSPQGADPRLYQPELPFDGGLPPVVDRQGQYLLANVDESEPGLW